MALIKTEKLTHRYSTGTPFERVAVYNVDFEAHAGEYIGIIGATGSGKSTFIQHLNGLLKPTSGSIFYDGVDIYETKEFLRELRFKVGLVFQYPEYQLFEATVFEDIAFGPKNMGLSEEEIKNRVYESARFVGLAEALLKKSPFELSGGEKRRAAIAGVISMQPKVLILDEPTAGLDPRGQAEIIQNISDYKEAQGATIILVTHNMDEIARRVDRLVVLNAGTVIMTGSPAEIFSQTSKLSELGLAAPKASMISARLRLLGLSVSAEIYTIAQLKKALIELKGRGDSVNA